MTKELAADAIEVFLTWGEGDAACILVAAYVRRGERFTLGEADGCDAVVPFEVLGSVCAHVVTWDGGPVVAPTRRARVWIDGRSALAERIPLRPEEVVDVSFGAFTLRARLVARDPWATPPRGELTFDGLAGFALSAFVHLACLAVLSFYLPAGAPDAEIARDQTAAMRTLLDASAQRERRDPAKEKENAAPPSRHDPSAAHRQVASTAPPPVPTADDGPPPVTSADPRARRSAAPATEGEEAASFGMIALAHSLAIDPGEPNPWKDVVASLDARASQVNALFGDPPIERFAIGGLALSGVGEGGGGKGEGIDLVEVGSLAASLERRLASGDPGGFGCRGEECPGHVADRRTSGLRVRFKGDIALYGGLDQDSIKRVVQANAGRFRNCYGAGLRRNPALEGRVSVAFEIGARGEVAVARDDGSDLPDDAVRACIVKSFFTLSFPPPHAGAVKVRYPMVFKPEG